MKNGFTLIEVMIVVAILAILTAIVIPSCQEHNDPQGYARRMQQRHAQILRNDSMAGIVIYTDPQTGCQYLKNIGVGMTPRMGSDGKQICNSNGSF